MDRTLSQGQVAEGMGLTSNLLYLDSRTRQMYHELAGQLDAPQQFINHLVHQHQTDM
jgi:hypothetical protein